MQLTLSFMFFYLDIFSVYLEGILDVFAQKIFEYLCTYGQASFHTYTMTLGYGNGLSILKKLIIRRQLI